MKNTRLHQSPLCYSIFSKHLNVLKDYRQNLENYFEMCKKYGYDNRSRPMAEYISDQYPEDYAKYEQSKRNLNLLEKKIYQALNLADVSSKVFYSPPPITGGIQGWISLPANIFNHRSYEFSKQEFVNMIERAEGYFTDWISYWRYRRWNPYFYFKKIILKILNLPVDAYEYFYRKDDSKNLPAKITAIFLFGILSLIIYGGTLTAGGLAILKFIQTITQN